MDPELALEVIEKSAGSHFDPKVAATFLKAWELGYIQALLERNRSKDFEIKLPFPTVTSHRHKATVGQP